MILEIPIGPFAVGLEVAGPRSAALVDQTFLVRPGGDPMLAPALLLRDGAGDAFEMGRAGEPTQDASGPEAALEWLMEQVSRALADRCTRGLLVHGGATRVGGGVVLWPGESGAGKSTLVAWLVSRGHAFLADELALVLEAGAAVHGLRRALNLKRGASASAERHRLTEIGRGPARAHCGGWLVPTHRLPIPPPAPLAAVVFPRFDLKGSLSLTRLTGAQAIHALLPAAINARHFPDCGLSQAMSLARRVPAFRLCYRGFDEVATTIGRIETLVNEQR